MTRTFQARLGKYSDRLNRKIIDNQISLMGTPTDCIRVRTTRNKQGDIETRIVEEAEVLPFVFPPMKDVPLRRMVRDAGPGAGWKMETLPAADELFPIELITTHYSRVYIDDLIFRFILEPDTTHPLCLALTVVDPVATFGSQSVIYGKLRCTYYNQPLPQEILDSVAAMATRRGMLGW